MGSHRCFFFSRNCFVLRTAQTQWSKDARPCLFLHWLIFGIGARAFYCSHAFETGVCIIQNQVKLDLSFT